MSGERTYQGRNDSGQRVFTNESGKSYAITTENYTGLAEGNREATESDLKEAHDNSDDDD